MLPTLTDPPDLAAAGDPVPHRRTRRFRPQADRDAARKRIMREKRIRLADLAGQPLDLEGATRYPTLPALTRWGVEGRRGVFLDVTRFTRGGDWFTSREAVARFVQGSDAAFWNAYVTASRSAAPAPTATQEARHGA